jgi:predicted SAM-dependent methyltransferase
MKPSETVSGAVPDSPLHQVQRSWSPYANASTRARARMRSVWANLGFNHDLASKIRYELDMVLLRTRCSLSPAYRSQVRELAERRHLLVHLGCGNALLPGWINLDCYPPPPARDVEILTLDLRRGLPLAAASAAALFSEHFLEHLPFDTVRSVVLPDIRRVMEPGGRVRIGVPDGEYFIDQYAAYREGRRNELFERERGGKTPMVMINEIAHGYGHHFVYDFETLSQLLRESGFVNVRRCEPFDTSMEHFEGKDRVDEWRNTMTLYVEAEVPAISD